MKIIKQSWDFINEPDGEQILKLIELAGRTCYKSEEKITPESSKLFIKKLIDSGHHAMIEHGSISVKMGTDRGCCYDDLTEVLTHSGWKFFKNLTKDDKLAGLTDEGELVWDIPIKLYEFRHDEYLCHFETTSIDLLVTSNHNMWVLDYDKRSPSTRIWKFIQAENLKNKRYMFTKTAKYWKGSKTVITIPAHRTKYKQYPSIEFDHNKTTLLF